MTLRYLLIGLFFVVLSATSVPALATPYGVIEFSTSAIRGFVVEDGESRGLQIAARLPMLEQAPGTPANLAAVLAQADSLVVEMVDQYRVDHSHIYVVVSSGLAETEQFKNVLRDAITRRLGLDPDILAASTETRLNFDGAVAGLIKARRREVVLIDIGSGNIKGNFLNTRGTPPHIPFEWRELGVKQLAKRARDLTQGPNPGLSYDDALASVIDHELRPAIRAELAHLPDLALHKRVYLSGGIVWAFALLSAPRDQRRWVPLNAFDDPATTPHGRHLAPGAFLSALNDLDARRQRSIDALYSPGGPGGCLFTESQIAHSDSASRDTLCESVATEIDRLSKQVFDVNEIQAGFAILRALYQELSMQDKTVFYLREALWLWTIPYVAERINRHLEPAGDQPPFPEVKW